MRLHSAFIGQPPDRILVTGGASKNPGILRVLADVFQAEIVPLRVSNSSALGGALRAAQAVEGQPWGDLYARFAAPDLDRRVAPDPAIKSDLRGPLKAASTATQRPGGRNHRKEIGTTHVQARLPRNRAHPLPARRAGERPGVPLLRQGQEGPRQAHGRPPAHGGLLLAHVRVERLRRVRRRHVRPGRGTGTATPVELAKEKAAAAFELFEQAGRPVLLLPRPRRRPRGQVAGRDQRHPRPDHRRARSGDEEDGHQAAVGDGEPVLAPALHGRRGDQPRSRGVRLRRGAGEEGPGGHASGWAARTTSCGAAAKATRRCSTPT